MSFVRLAAALIRHAVVDEAYEQDLQDVVASDSALFAGLVHAAIQKDDLGWLSPNEWRWYARWRQGQGGALDDSLIGHLTSVGGSRFARFELRSLVMRDPDTEQQAPTADAAAPQQTVGLRWLQTQAGEFPDSYEIIDDALQIATESAWFTLRVLTGLPDPRGSQVRAELERLAQEREISRQISERWTREENVTTVPGSGGRAMADNPAPPFPSNRSQVQSWTSGAKDVVTTTLTGRVWATVGQGIVNEVFWPAVDQPQVKDFGFLVRTAEGPQWREVKAVAEYSVTPAEDPSVPPTTITHTGDFYELSLQAITAPDQDALLVGFKLTSVPENAGRSLSLYPLLAPHLGRYTASAGNQLGMDNVAWVQDGALFARDGTGARVLCLVSSTGFARTSVGFVGDSDGWTDLHLHQAMTWDYTSAGPGAVALTSELLAPEGTLAGTLALGFGTGAEEARAAAQAALNAGIDPAKNALAAQWQDRARTLTIPGTSDGLSSELVAALQQSATVLHANEDRHTSGAIVAGLATPWGDQTNDAGGYHMVWCRDSCETALALAALGDLETGARLLGFLADRQDKNPLSPDYGSWARCYFLDGSSLAGLQLDEIAFPVLLAAKLTELGADLPNTILDMVHRATTFLVRSGPASGVDRWEETQGTSPFSLALIVVALIVTAQTMLQDPEKSYALSVADNWNERLEEFTYVSEGVLDRAFDTAGHYVRIGGPADQVRLSNQLQQDVRVSAELMVGLEFLYLTRLGLRDPADQRFTDTLKIVDRMLARETLAGEAFCRYDLDGYGEWIDGSGWPIRQFGIGRPWPLLVGERGHYELLVGQDVKPDSMRCSKCEGAAV